MQITEELISEGVVSRSINIGHGEMKVRGGGLEDHHNYESRGLPSGKGEEVKTPSSEQAATGANRRAIVGGI